MTTKGDAHRSYRIHGEGLESLGGGLVEIGLPEDRRAIALHHARHVADANHALTFSWYKTPGKNELCCWWDNREHNVLWLSTNNVHVRPQSATMPDHEPTDWIGHDGHVGWYLPGCTP